MNSTAQNFMKEWGFGELIEKPIPLNGGFNHQTWYIKLHTGEYVVKQLNDIIIQQEGSAARYENSETIAQTLFEQGIPAVPAKKTNGQYLQKYKDKYYMFYPYIDAAPIFFPQVRNEHIEVIGKLLAKIHNLSISNINLPAHRYKMHSSEQWKEYIKEINLPDLHALEGDILRWNDILYKITEQSPENMIISHKDMHYLNVMWDNSSNPYIVDWETAGWTIPVAEVISQGMEWTGFFEATFSKQGFAVLAESYKRHIKIDYMSDLTKAFYWWVGGNSSMDWLALNISRILNNEIASQKERDMRVLIIKKMTRSLQFVKEHEKDLLACIREIFLS